MKNLNNYPPYKFTMLYEDVFKVYQKIFLDKKKRKIYWFGVASMPLIILSTAVIFKKKNIKNSKLINLKDYYERISIEYFHKFFSKKTIFKNFLYKVLNKLVFFKNKITVIYSSNKYTENFCKKKNLFIIKYNPFTLLNQNKINTQNIDNEFSKLLEVYISELNRKFLNIDTRKKKQNLNEIKKFFVYFYKIYLIFIHHTANTKCKFITSYSSIFFIRLFLAAIRYNNKSKFINLTHGEIEILNQKLDIIYDGATLSHENVCKSKNFLEQYQIFFYKNKNLFIKPKISFYNNRMENFSYLKIKKKKINPNFKKKKILIVGYPFSKKFDVTVPHIFPSKMYFTENKLLKFFLKKKDFEVFYKAHPDTWLITRKKISIKKNFLIEPFEDLFMDYDYLIFTAHRTTTLGYALRTKKPILLFFHKKMDLDKKTLNVYKKRISLINCYINSKHLMDFHESSIINNLHKAKNLAINKTGKDIFRL